MSENSSTQETQEEQAKAAPDSTELLRAEIQREYAGKLAQAEMNAQAAKGGINLPDGFTNYIDASKLLGEDGNPSAEAISKALAPFRSTEPEFVQFEGLGHFRRNIPESVPRASLDVRNR